MFILSITIEIYYFDCFFIVYLFVKYINSQLVGDMCVTIHVHKVVYLSYLSFIFYLPIYFLSCFIVVVFVPIVHVSFVSFFSLKYCNNV